jgi:hypothetical protein
MLIKSLFPFKIICRNYNFPSFPVSLFSDGQFSICLFLIHPLNFQRIDLAHLVIVPIGNAFVANQSPFVIVGQLINAEISVERVHPTWRFILSRCPFTRKLPYTFAETADTPNPSRSICPRWHVLIPTSANWSRDSIVSSKFQTLFPRELKRFLIDEIDGNKFAANLTRRSTKIINVFIDDHCE